MILLKTLIKEIDEDKNEDIADIDDEREWKWSDVDHLFNMKFDRVGNSIFVLKNPPIKVYKIKKGPFIIEEPVENHVYQNYEKGKSPPINPLGTSAFETSKQIIKYKFSTFTKVINFFDRYEQEM